jgi:hypothetical protein
MLLSPNFLPRLSMSSRVATVPTAGFVSMSMNDLNPATAQQPSPRQFST